MLLLSIVEVRVQLHRVGSIYLKLPSQVILLIVLIHSLKLLAL